MWNAVITDAMRVDLERRIEALGRDPTLPEVQAMAEDIARTHMWHDAQITVTPDPKHPRRFLVSSAPDKPRA